MEKLMKLLNRPLGFVDKRVCALIAVTLMFTGFCISFHAVDQKYALAGMFAGILYMLTIFAFVFEDGIDTGDKNNKRDEA